MNSTSDLRLALRGLRRNPLFASVAILSLALGIGANTAIFTLIDQILLRKLPVAAPEQLVMLYQQGPHNGSNMGTRMHSYPIYQDYQQRAEPLAEVLCRRLIEASVSVDNQTERVQAEMVSGNFFTMLGVKPAIGRVFNSQEDDQTYQGHPVGGARVRLLGQPVRQGSWRRRQEDPRQQLSDDDRRRLGTGLRWNRSGAIAADSRAGADEADDGAGLDLAAHGRSPRTLDPGVRPTQARVHRRICTSPPAGSLHTDSRARNDAARGERLVRLLTRAVHEGPLARHRSRDGFFRHPQRFLDCAGRVDVHGRPGAAHRLRKRCEPADRARILASERDRSTSVARRITPAARPAVARREPGAVVHRRCGRPRDLDGPDPRIAGADSRRRLPTPDKCTSRPADPVLHARPHVRDRHHLRPVASAARKPARSVDHIERHRRIDRRRNGIAVPAKRPGHVAGGAELPASVRRRPVRPQPAEPADHRHRCGARQPGDVPVVAGSERLHRRSERSSSTTHCSPACARHPA